MDITVYVFVNVRVCVCTDELRADFPFWGGKGRAAVSSGGEITSKTSKDQKTWSISIRLNEYHLARPTSDCEPRLA